MSRSPQRGQPGADPESVAPEGADPGDSAAEPAVGWRRRRAAWLPSRRHLLTHGAVAAGALVAGGFAGTRLERVQRDAVPPPPLPPRVLLDDASGLDATAVRGVTFAGPSGTATAERITPLLRRIGRGEDPPIVVSGARHSMGGQSLLRDGWVLDALPMNAVSVDAETATMRVGAGARWKDVIRVLHADGLAPTVMQSNHDFTVGGSLSVNCHGWHANSQPIASTVRSIRLLTADGEITSCSPETNAGLFSHALGGYGLFGVILDADLAVVPDVMYEPRFDVVPTSDYAAAFAERVYAPRSGVEMAYGRLSVDPGSFLEEAIIGTYSPDETTRGRVLPLAPEGHNGLRRAVFTNSVGSGAGKSLRWFLERRLNPRLVGPVSRNSILSADAGVLANADPGVVYLLHEYFVPQQRLWEFVRSVRRIVRPSGADLLNVTVRDVRQDRRSVLAYARTDVFGLVMSFVQERTPAGEARMRDLTRQLIDAALDAGGTFYLPYRPHATAGQLVRAYPAWRGAMRTKTAHDPAGLFRNTFYDRYRAA